MCTKLSICRGRFEMSKVESIFKVGFVLVSNTEVILSLFQVFNKWQKNSPFLSGYWLLFGYILWLRGNGSFCRYWGTDYVQQKKQYNQTIKPSRERALLFGFFDSLVPVERPEAYMQVRGYFEKNFWGENHEFWHESCSSRYQGQGGVGG